MWIFLRQISSSNKKIETILVTFLLSCFGIHSSTASAYKFAGGMSAIEEGDDRIRPGMTLYTGFGHFYYGRAFHYGRTFGPVTEKITMISLNRKFGLFRSKNIRAGVGMTILQEDTSILYENEEDQKYNIAESRINGGLFTGIYWSPFNAKSTFVTLSWEAGIFPAGATGGLFLATGRKQFASILAGVRL